MQRFVKAILRWVINPEGGVKAINFQAKDGTWMIVGFESELQNRETLEHEQREIEYRKQGLSWLEAHNQAVKEEGRGEEIDRLEARKYKAGRQDEIGAGKVVSLSEDMVASSEVEVIPIFFHRRNLIQRGKINKSVLKDIDIKVEKIKHNEVGVIIIDTNNDILEKEVTDYFKDRYGDKAVIINLNKLKSEIRDYFIGIITNKDYRDMLRGDGLRLDLDKMKDVLKHLDKA